MTINRIELIESSLNAALNPTHLEIIDQAKQHEGHRHEGAGHFVVKIVSEQFEQQGVLQRHRLVYDALGDLMQTDIHALSIQAMTPTEFSQ